MTALLVEASLDIDTPQVEQVFRDAPPDDPVARRRLGDLLLAHGFFAEAARQYETLARLTPDDPKVLLLRASAAECQGLLEEALKWAEKGGITGAPDGTSGAAVTARALSATHLAWGRLAALEGKRAEEHEALSARAARVLSNSDPRETYLRLLPARRLSPTVTHAAEVFRARGYEAARVEEIAERADMSVGSIYLHFDGKRGLYLTLVDNALELFTQYMARSEDAAFTPLQRVLAGGDAYLRFHLDHPGAFQFLAFRAPGEDPLADDDLYNYVKLKQHLHIPILATEYAPGGFTAYAPWITAQATDFLRGDVAVKGGITPLVKTAHLAEAFHMNFEVHHGGNSLNNVANLHVIMAIRNCEFFEVLLPAGAQKYGLAEDIEVDGQGLVHAFNGPGLGAAIDFALIERKKVAVLS